MSSHLTTAQLFLTSDTAQPLKVTRNVANQSIQQILNLNLRALAHIYPANPESQLWNYSLARALLKTLDNGGKLVFLMKWVLVPVLGRFIYLTPSYLLFLCDKPRG